MTLPIAVQLYSVRDDLSKDYAGTLRKIAAMGYRGVETAGLPPKHMSARDVARLMSDLDMQIVASHAPLPLRENLGATLDMLEGFGCKQVVCAWLDPHQYFQDADQVRRACDLLNEANVEFRKRGLTLHYHNHWFELAQIEGRPALLTMLDHLDPSVQIELDIYWVQTGQADALALLKALGGRSTLLHIKDGPCTVEGAMVAVGQGQVDYARIIPAVQTTAQWLIVELDRTDGDMLQAVADSYTYLTGQGLAHGKR
jgi:sugar phosphate isomerase/epimerase